MSSIWCSNDDGTDLALQCQKKHIGLTCVCWPPGVRGVEGGVHPGPRERDERQARARPRDEGRLSLNSV